jgi:hypothetical protein
MERGKAHRPTVLFPPFQCKGQWRTMSRMDTVNHVECSREVKFLFNWTIIMLLVTAEILILEKWLRKFTGCSKLSNKWKIRKYRKTDWFLNSYKMR